MGEVDFKIVNKGPEGVWYNSKIGRKFSGILTKKIDNPSITGYLVNGVWFVPATQCELSIKNVAPVIKIRKEKKNKANKKSPTIQVKIVDANTKEVLYFKDRTNAAKHIGVNHKVLINFMNDPDKNKTLFLNKYQIIPFITCD